MALVNVKFHILNYMNITHKNNTNNNTIITITETILLQM